jgi:hypothetical protein
MSIEGAPYKIVEQNQIYGTFFFLSDELVTHSRDAENFLSILSKFGGLFTLSIAILTIPGRYTTRRLLFSKFIRTLYL